ncbi:exo-alpha-sialidase [Horticoccus luteus]|uniref:Exo-alpha-sialidase n=1 Tax=Horticoccus luteus TaxID=2862869 RepID=A0A8F9TVC8_9BACT|nr:exo-alpha-sialidase [Horticoccus luteus]QYM78272.1 exo-alpha-sialidase [Horticoccus luteus]
MLRVVALVLCSTFLTASAAAADASLHLAALPAPGAPHASAPAFATSPDGAVYLSWLEPAGEAQAALRIARYDAATGQWTAPHTIATTRAFASDRTAPPQLAAANNGQLAAVWTTPPDAKNISAWVSRSSDAGTTWSAPEPLTTASATVEFPAVALSPQGRAFSAWLDGRAHPGGPTQLSIRPLATGATADAVDQRVCDCCAPALLAFPDGSALVAYRDRSSEEVRDIAVARFTDGEWSEPTPLNEDGWHLDGCPVDGPRLSAVGGHVAAIWFTAADHDPRVLTSFSPDAGERFTMPQRVELRRAVGRPDIVSLRDGTRVVSWIEAADPSEKRPATLYARRVSPQDELGEPVALAPANDVRALGFPRLALVKDYDQTPAQVVAVYGTDDGLAATLLTLPPLSALAGRAPCAPCDEAEAAAARGFALRGEVVSLTPARHTVLVKHDAIPGVMQAMTMEFTVDDATFRALAVGQTILGRIERRGRTWWLFAVKTIGAAQSS